MTKHNLVLYHSKKGYWTFYSEDPKLFRKPFIIGNLGFLIDDIVNFSKYFMVATPEHPYKKVEIQKIDLQLADYNVDGHVMLKKIKDENFRATYKIVSCIDKDLIGNEYLVDSKIFEYFTQYPDIICLTINKLN